MIILHTAYLILTAIIGFSSIGDSELFTILALFIAPLISWWGGSGMRGAFHVGDKTQKLTGFVLGIVFLTIGIFWMWYEQTYVVIFNFEMIGEIWCIIGFLVGFIFTSKSDAR